MKDAITAAAGAAIYVSTDRGSAPRSRSGEAGRGDPRSTSDRAGIGRRIASILRVWFARRRQRLELAELDDDQLRDLGIERSEALRESRKPFWR